MLSNLQPVDVPQRSISIQFYQLSKDLQIYDQWSHGSNVYLFNYLVFFFFGENEWMLRGWNRIKILFDFVIRVIKRILQESFKPQASPFALHQPKL